MTGEPGACHICAALASTPPQGIVLDADGWLAYGVADVPGWVMLASREHVEGADGLTEAHAATLGPVLRRLAAAVRETTGAARVHVVFLGDNSPHFHLGLFPRGPGQDSLFDNARLVAEVGERRDAAEAQATCASIRAAL